MTLVNANNHLMCGNVMAYFFIVCLCYLSLALGKGLGIGFGQSSRSGIFIKYLARGSDAAKNGSLQYVVEL